MGEDVNRLDAMDRCFEKYRVGPLTDERRARIDAELLELVNVEPLTERLARVAGIALAAVRGATSIDAVVMASAASRGDVVLTSDPVDLERLRGYFPGVRVLVV